MVTGLLKKRLRRLDTRLYYWSERAEVSAALARRACATQRLHADDTGVDVVSTRRGVGNEVLAGPRSGQAAWTSPELPTGANAPGRSSRRGTAAAARKAVPPWRRMRDEQAGFRNLSKNAALGEFLPLLLRCARVMGALRERTQVPDNRYPAPWRSAAGLGDGLDRVEELDDVIGASISPTTRSLYFDRTSAAVPPMPRGTHYAHGHGFRSFRPSASRNSRRHSAG